MAANSGENAVSQIQDCTRSVYNLVVNDLCSANNESSASINAINEMHEKVNTRDDKKLTPADQEKMKGLYSTALQDARNEEQAIRKALEKIYEMQAIKNGLLRSQGKSLGKKETFRRGLQAQMKALQMAAQRVPLWMGSPGEKPPPLCGAIPAESDYVAEVGHMVAAFHKLSDGEENWILAEVAQYNLTAKTYDVIDIDEQQKDSITISRRRVIPLPLMRANPVTHPNALFPKNSLVIALYPQTTCFYDGIIHSIPSAPLDEYEVVFDDSSYPEGYGPPLRVPQRYVLSAKDLRKKKGK